MGRDYGPLIRLSSYVLDRGRGAEELYVSHAPKCLRARKCEMICARLYPEMAKRKFERKMEGWCGDWGQRWKNGGHSLKTGSSCHSFLRQVLTSLGKQQ